MEKRMTDDPSIWAVPGDVRERVRQLLCDLVAIPSYGGQEEAIIRYLVERFARQGIACRVTELDSKPLNVVAEIGNGSRTTVLNSHVDTVPPGEPGDLDHLGRRSAERHPTELRHLD
jgi:acetylornithine deacetylase/succinyl-diaminopimelate desuccinylase-like protein